MTQPDYDEKTLNQMRFIEIEKQITNLKEDVRDMTSRHFESLERIKTLEDARTVQIILNQKWSKKYSKPLPKPSFWDLFKK